MIHFDFQLSDIDAENLIYAIRESALRNDEYIMEWHAKVHSCECTTEQAETYIKWHNANKAYMLGLIQQMSNTRIAED